MLYKHLRTRIVIPCLAIAGSALLLAGTASAQAVVDPLGDASASATMWVHDIKIADAQAIASTSELILSAVFANTISAFSTAPAADALAGLILLDVDKNAATGAMVPVDGASASGVEWIVDLGTSSAAFGFALVTPAGGGFGTFLAAMTMTSSAGGPGVDGFEVTIPWNKISSPDGLVNFALASKNRNGEVTDFAPDATAGAMNFAMSTAVPEPGTLPLAALGSIGLAFLGRRRR